MKPITSIISALRTQHKTMLGDFERKYTPFQILVATVMSARTKDSTTMPFAEKMLLTHIEHRFEDADTFFPEIDLTQWQIVSEEFHSVSDKNQYALSFVTYEKIT